MTYSEFFTKLANGAKWDIGVSINRTNPLPLDQYSVFESLEALNTYAASNPVAYPGQVVAVLATGGTQEAPEYTAEAYIIKSVGTGAVVMKLASTTASGDVTADIVELQGKVAALESWKTTADADITEIKDTLLPQKMDKNSDIAASGDEYRVVQYDAKGLVVAGRAIADTDVPGLAQVKSDVAANASEIATLKEQVTGGVHWVGQATVDFGDPTFPGIAEYTPVAGDICARNGIEYIYNGSVWQEFGNEGAHITLEQVKSEIDTKIGELDVAQLDVGASKTLSYIKEDDGKIAAATVDIQIAESQVTGLSDDLAAKQDKNDNLTAIGNAAAAEGFLYRDGEGAYQYKEAVSAEEVAAIAKTTKVDNAVAADTATSAATANKVANALTINVDGESTTFDGSAAKTVNITIPELAAATADTLGGVKLGSSTEMGERELPLEYSETKGAYVTAPAETVYGVIADGGLQKVGNDFGIAAGSVTNGMLASNSVSNDKIESVDANKLTQDSGDYLILNCGDSTSL